jgi:hypothetical protein
MRSERWGGARRRVELTLKERGELVDLFWLASALDHVRSLNQTDVVDYLQSVADDLIFETKMAAHKAALLSRLTGNAPTDARTTPGLI